MRKSIILLCVFIAVMFSAGCTHLSFKNTYKNTCLEPARGVNQVKASRVAIFPFADYSYRQEGAKPLLWGLNRKLLEDLTDEFVKRGIMVSIQEDTEGLLISEGIIKAFDPDELSGRIGSIAGALGEEGRKPELSYIAPERELERTDHSEEMVAEVKKMVKEKKDRAPDGRPDDQLLAQIMNIISLDPREPLVNGVTASLSKEKIIDLGKKLDVDLIVRGRIIEAGTLDKAVSPSFSNQGVIPFMVSPIKNFFLGKGEKPVSLGYAEKEKYELGLLDSYSLKSRPTGREMSVLQVRVYLQDAGTGDLIWTGRAEASYNPDVFKRYYKGMFDKVSKQVAVSLGGDLFRVPKTEKRKTAGGNKGVIYSNVP
ncbi:MAG: hypothetical protein WC335_05845 [Candidatus Omnitrophota bacterium]|jgi:hypothetical protein